MAIVRHEGNGNTLLEPFGRSVFDWPMRTLEMWRHFGEEDSIKVDEFMDGDELVIRAELPGVDPERDVDVSIVDGALVIRAERRQEDTVKERHMRRSELRYGSFSRIVPLPPGAKESDIQATYKDGLLEVRTHVEERKSKQSKIQIKRA